MPCMLQHIYLDDISLNHVPKGECKSGKCYKQTPSFSCMDQSQSPIMIGLHESECVKLSITEI